MPAGTAISEVLKPDLPCVAALQHNELKWEKLLRPIDFD